VATNHNEPHILQILHHNFTEREQPLDWKWGGGWKWVGYLRGDPPVAPVWVGPWDKLQLSTAEEDRQAHTQDHTTAHSFLLGGLMRKTDEEEPGCEGPCHLFQLRWEELEGM